MSGPERRTGDPGRDAFLRAVWVVGYREILRLVGQKSRLVASILTPLLFFGLFGAGFNQLVGQIFPGVDLLTFMFPGIVAMTVIMPSVFTGMSVVWDREFGFLRVVLVSPLSRTGIALGKVGGGAAVATLEGLVLLALAPLVGVQIGLGQLALLVPLLLLLSGMLSAFGILVGVRIRSQEAFQTVMALLVFPLIFLSGVFFPVDATPGWMAAVSKLNPVTYGVDAVRQVLLAGSGGVDVAAVTVPEGHPPLGVSVLGQEMGVGAEALLMAVVGVVLVALASRAFGEG